MDRLRNAFSKDPCQRFYTLTRVLGRGSFASVRLAISKSDGTKWAVKIIDKQSLSQEDEEALKTEVKILQAMDHPNIVRFREVFDSSNLFYMVMELCTGGELFDRIVMKDHYTENEARDCIIQIVKAISYCHENGIVHRDLKPENLLYSDSDETQAVLKLADFGLAKLLHPEAMLTTACGTPGYVAPEILQSRPYGKAVDMWSVGVIAYILLCGFPPFYDENHDEMFRAIKAGRYEFPSPFWDDVDPGAKDMIDCLLVIDPRERYSAEQLLAHPWVSQGPTEAGGRDLSHFKTSMKAYNARRKFKATIMTVQIMRALGRDAGVARRSIGDCSIRKPEESKESCPTKGVSANIADDTEVLDGVEIAEGQAREQEEPSSVPEPVPGSVSGEVSATEETVAAV